MPKRENDTRAVGIGKTTTIPASLTDTVSPRPRRLPDPSGSGLSARKTTCNWTCVPPKTTTKLFAVEKVPNYETLVKPKG
jgi:hypothetical protein